MSKEIVVLSNVSKKYQTHYREVVALSNINLQVCEGERIGIIGASGCGKTTVAKIICGIESPSSGDVLLFGQPIREFIKNHKAAYKKVQYIHQSSFETFDPLCKISSELLRVYKLHHNSTIGYTEKQTKLMKLLSLEDINLSRRYPNELSGGQLQRIAMLRSLLVEPELLILDEPTAMLDKETRDVIYRFLNGGECVPATFIVITHDKNLIKSCVTRTLLIENGVMEERFT